MTEKRKISGLQSGQVTVFGALLFMVVFSLLAAQYQSALYYMQKASAERAARLSVESFLAGYNRPLRDYYQILAADGGRGQRHFYAQGIEEELLSVFQRNLQAVPGMESGRSAQLEDSAYTLFIDGEWDFFLREITLNRKGKLAEGIWDGIVDLWKGANSRTSDELKEKQEAQKQAEAGKTETGKNEETEGKPENEVQIFDPRDFLAEIWNQGILAAACPEGI